jgi:hypothetical protein
MQGHAAGRSVCNGRQKAGKDESTPDRSGVTFECAVIWAEARSTPACVNHANSVIARGIESVTVGTLLANGFGGQGDHTLSRGRPSFAFRHGAVQARWLYPALEGSSV